MADFNVRSDAVDVEQIMRQIRARIREKRGADYTEAELHELASVKLEKFLDPRGLRSDLVEQFRRQREHVSSPPLSKLPDPSVYASHRGALTTIRRLLNPLLKLFMNPTPLMHAVAAQGAINDEIESWMRRREQVDDVLHYELLHNLVVEVTRLGIEVHNMKMRVESLSSRMDFDERRARSLEGVVEYRPSAPRRQGSPRPQPATAPGEPAATEAPASPAAAAAEGVPQERRRRRRRRRRRPGQTMAGQQNGAADTEGPFDAPEPGGDGEGTPDQ